MVKESVLSLTHEKELLIEIFIFVPKQLVLFEISKKKIENEFLGNERGYEFQTTAKKCILTY